MSLEQLANLGEFVGGVAVIVTLIYLTLQVKQNTRSIRSSTLATNTEYWTSLLLKNADEDMVDAYLLGMSGVADLEPRKFLQFFLLCRALFVSMEAQHHQYLEGALDEEIYLGYERSVTAQILSFPGFRRYWAQCREEFSPVFRTYIDDILKREPERHPAYLMEQWQSLATQSGT